MKFTQKQSKDFIEQLYKKKQLQTSIESLMKSLTVQLHIPVSIVNSGSKRTYENLFNSKEFEKNYTLTTSSIQVSLENVSYDGKQSTAPTNAFLFLNSGGIPHKFSVVTNQRVMVMRFRCKLLTSNAIEALQGIEYLIDNLTFPKVFAYKSMGIQYQGAYGLASSDLNANINKMFDYGNDPNTADIEFVIEMEVTYLAYRSANLIKFIYDHTIDPADPVNPIDTKPPLDGDTGGTPVMETGDGFLVDEYIGTVATVTPVDFETDEFDIDGGTWFHSDGITEDDLKNNIRVTVIDEANKGNVRNKP